MVLEMPPENRQCRCRGDMGGQPIPDPRNGNEKRNSDYRRYSELVCRPINNFTRSRDMKTSHILSLIE